VLPENIAVWNKTEKETSWDQLDLSEASKSTSRIELGSRSEMRAFVKIIIMFLI
jgi:hypothetical protein